MTESQDVLAEALLAGLLFDEFGWPTRQGPGREDRDHELVWGDSDNPAWAAATERIITTLATRGYALVRTPETLDSGLRKPADVMRDGPSTATPLPADIPFSVAPSPAPPEGLHDEFAWLIERGQPEKQVPTVWWADRKRWGLAHMDEWTEDANKAYRFASKAEAEDYIERHSPIPSHRPRLGRAVEHGFLATSPAPDPGAGLRDAAERVIDAWDHFESKYDLTTSLADLRAALAPSAEPPETET